MLYHIYYLIGYVFSKKIICLQLKMILSQKIESFCEIKIKNINQNVFCCCSRLSPGYTCKLVCQTTPQTNMLRPFLPLGSAHLLLQTVCREFVLEPAGSPQTDKKLQINSRCIANATLAVCPSNHCFKLV